MRSGFHRIRLTATVAAIGAATAVRCSDPTGTGSSSSGEGDRYFRLRVTQVDGGGPTSNGDEGDLILRPDSSYVSRGTLRSAEAFPGRWSQFGDSVLLTASSADPILPRRGAFAGDTLSFRGVVQEGRTSYITYLFRYVRAPLPSSALAGTRWVLRAVNGAAAPGGSGFLAYAGQGYSAYQGGRTVSRVLFDTLSFQDQVFYRDGRATVDSLTDAAGVLQQDLYNPYLTQSTGAYQANGATVILRYGSWAAGYAPETLSVSGATLVRRYLYRGSGPQVVESYARLP